MGFNVWATLAGAARPAALVDQHSSPSSPPVSVKHRGKSVNQLAPRRTSLKRAQRKLHDHSGIIGVSGLGGHKISLEHRFDDARHLEHKIVEGGAKAQHVRGAVPCSSWKQLQASQAESAKKEKGNPWAFSAEQ